MEQPSLFKKNEQQLLYQGYPMQPTTNQIQRTSTRYRDDFVIKDFETSDKIASTRMDSLKSNLNKNSSQLSNTNRNIGDIVTNHVTSEELANIPVMNGRTFDVNENMTNDNKLKVQNEYDYFSNYSTKQHYNQQNQSPTTLTSTYTKVPISDAMKTSWIRDSDRENTATGVNNHQSTLDGTVTNSNCNTTNTSHDNMSVNPNLNPFMQQNGFNYNPTNNVCCFLISSDISRLIMF